MSNAREILQLQNDVRCIRECTTTMNSELGGVREKQKTQNDTLIGIQTDVTWLKRFFFIVVIASVGALTTGFINLVKQ